MKLVVNNNIVFATHNDGQSIESLYPGMTTYIVPDSLKKTDGDAVLPGDDLVQCLDLDTIKSLQRSAIDDHLTAIRNAGFTCQNALKIQCAEVDLMRWMQANTLITIANLDEINIRDFDNVNHIVAAADFSVMMIEVGGYIQGLLTQAWSIKDQIDAAISAEEAFGIQWPTA